MSGVRPFDFSTDMPTIKKWWAQYGATAPDLGLLPPTGFISEHACVFLIKTDTELCMLEHMVVDKDYEFDRKGEILDVGIAAIKHAKEMGFTIIWALSTFSGVKEAAEIAGFKQTDVIELYAREL